MISQKEFLIGQGIDQYSSPEQIQTAKKAYRKTYVKHYQKEYNQSTKRVKLTFNLREFHLLHKAALKHQKPLASFGKECVLAYLQKEFIVPDEESVHSLQVGLNRIGNNLNQIARWANSSRGDINRGDIKEIYRMYGELDSKLDKLFRQPDTLSEFLEKKIQENPTLLVELQHILISILIQT